MIIWNDDIYIEEKLKKKVKKIKRALEKEKPTFSIYCVTKASNSKNLFDILDANEMLFSYYKRNNIEICGIASSRDAAIELVRQMVEELAKKGYFDKKLEESVKKESFDNR